jgi:hypothetical protein
MLPGLAPKSPALSTAARVRAGLAGQFGSVPRFGEVPAGRSLAG